MGGKSGVRAVIIALAVLAALGSALLAVAGRFWFERPEAIPSQPAAPQTTYTASPNEPPAPIPAPVAEPTAEPTPEPTPEPTVRPQPQIKGGELLHRYEDKGVTLELRRFETGAGQERVTYFIAEVLLADMSRLASGFAKDTFGRNFQEKPSSIAKRHEALLAVNGDYYGFRDDGVMIRDGVLYRDAPAREGAAILPDGRLILYDETEATAEELMAMGALHAFSFGPILLQDSVAPRAYQTGISGLNPRTAIGMIAPGHFVWAVVDGRLKGYSRGMTLRELSALFAELGCTDAYNLDGGGTSTMIWDGELINLPQGKATERASSDILYITGE